MAIELAAARSGQIFAVQLSEDFTAQPPAPGSVVKIGAFNMPYPVLNDLPVPNDIAFDGQGNLFVVVNTTSPAGSPPTGPILKCDLSAVPPPAPVKTVEATPTAKEAGQVVDADSRDWAYLTTTIRIRASAADPA